jgi:hypothetical protein
VNPYSLIVTKEGKLCFLDIGADSNRKRIQTMQRRNIREVFRPKGDDLYQRESERIDIYGLGKTLQYLLAFIEVEPVFTRKEEKRMKILISRCISERNRRRFEKFSDVMNYLIELKIT